MKIPYVLDTGACEALASSLNGFFLSYQNSETLVLYALYPDSGRLRNP